MICKLKNNVLTCFDAAHISWYRPVTCPVLCKVIPAVTQTSCCHTNTANRTEEVHECQFSWSPLLDLQSTFAFRDLLRFAEDGSRGETWLSYYPKRPSSLHFSVPLLFCECMRKMRTTPKLPLTGGWNFCCRFPGYFLSRFLGS